MRDMDLAHQFPLSTYCNNRTQFIIMCLTSYSAYRVILMINLQLYFENKNK